MHLEFLVEDQSGCLALECLVPKIIGPFGQPHTWRLHAYRGVGRIPRQLARQGDRVARILLENLPRLLRGYGRSLPAETAVVVLFDTDRRDCAQVLRELRDLLAQVDPAPRTLFRLAIEELEAWYFGDRAAVMVAYPRAKAAPLDRYQQDTVCDTWERLADAIYPGGSAALLKLGFPACGQTKCEWAQHIAPHMVPERNQSPSFGKFRDGLRRLVKPPAG